MKTDRDLSLPALLVTVVLWASAFVAIRAVGDTFSPGSLTLGRLVVGAVALLAVARPTAAGIPRGRILGLVVVYGLTWSVAYNIALNAAERDLDAGTTALIVNIAPALIALLAGFIFKDGFPRPLIIGMLVAFAGVALIALGGDQHAAGGQSPSTAGVVLCVLAALFYATGALVQKPVLAFVSPVMCVWLGCVVGVVACLPFAPALVDEVSTASVHDLLWLVYLGVFPTAIGFSTWSYALQRISAGQAASTTYLVPAVATLVSWAVLDEVPVALAFVGGALCLVGVAITRLRPRGSRPPARDGVSARR
ncbi:DMT family transporter [Aeromicrobium chenweiae]|uniref:EamA family transporter n=1 Tax=Aeromicrobium chenweiae TaxID=2079793 RepID=A0A2S0WR32_9ACTN|nr:DMT family transporter [Aeromicrobium chenweiae]AWB93823.1 EamA family transporter [Aeromicrobium chenweiae]TGN30868.1 DMT family transporter [Aeromicrobium chenweiae]